MPNFNQVTLVGNAVRDPELRYTPGGAAVCEFSIAVNERWKDKNGQQQERVGFFDCVAWARLAEVIAEYVKKGKPILVSGRLTQDRWEDKNTGQKKSRIRITAGTVQFLGTGGGRGDDAQAPQGQGASVGDTDFGNEPPPEDIPF